MRTIYTREVMPRFLTEVVGDGMRAEGSLARHLTVAEALRHQVGDAPLRDGQAPQP